MNSFLSRLNLVASNRRHLYLLAAIMGFSLCVLAIMLAISARKPTPITIDALSPYSDLLPGASLSTYLAHEFTCHINKDLPLSAQNSQWDYCSLSLPYGLVSAIRVDIVDGFSASVDFVLSDGALNIGNMVQQWGPPNMQRQDKEQTVLHWANPPRTAFGEMPHGDLALTSIWQIVFIGNRQFTK